MKNQKTRYAFIGALLALFAVVSQFYLNLTVQEEPKWMIVLRYFSYFTMVSNLLVGLHLGALALPTGTKRWPRYTSPLVSTAMTTYITITMIVYYVMLAKDANPQGFQAIINLTLHLFVPLFMIVFWVLFVEKKDLQWKMVGRWLLTPLVYFIYAMVLGAFIDKYPYPFFQVDVHGWTRVIITALIILGFFGIMGMTYIGIGKILGSRKR
ncbi:MAG TPA: hypothetical protein DCE41_14785 [Cytophagales bacterium]|nr:hypothetical protein [Cytophagales bacterium]HAA17843.1 hypothetical protein [Cytophagales bacterium]HAP58235.1 hypothetical protein [Cytophagales bacterium]